MTTDSRLYDRQGRPTLTEHNTHDLDTAQHFLADHVTELIVAFDHHAANPEVFIYVATSDGTLSAGDYCCCLAIPSMLTAERKCPHDGACEIDAARAGKTSGTQQLTG